MSAPQPGRRRVVKKVAGHGHHGGAWKIAYADFVTAMMALFMVLWLLASTDQQSREEISRYFRTGIMPEGELAMNGGAQSVPSIIEKAPAPPPPNQASLDEQVRSLRDAIQHVAENHIQLADLASRVRVVATEEGALIEIVDEDRGRGLIFDLSSAELKPPLVLFLGSLAPILAARPEVIELQGHTDARPFAAKTGRTNWELSFERAAAARKVLEASGIDPRRIVGVVGRGAATLLEPDDPLSARNRRLSILLRARPPVAGTQPAAPRAPAEGTRPVVPRGD